MSWDDHLTRNQTRYVRELCDFVAIPSVSADPAHRQDMARAADWVARRLSAAGVDHARVIETAGHPVVCADWLHAGTDRPTVLIYGHFDVQPPEPLAAWTSPPFRPEIRDGRVYGRGASDDKGGMLTPILAVEALLATTGRLPVNVKFFFEGEEEIGSPSVPAVVREMAAELSADMIFSADGLQWSPTQPQIVEALKGLLKLELVVRGPRSDQHSGLHGGGIANPAMALAQVLARLKSPDGLVTVPGFYDQVVPLTPVDREEIARIPYDEAAYLAETGAPAVAGEPGYSTRERLWARPTLDVNGLTSGWQGEGSKTVLPAEARAKITLSCSDQGFTDIASTKADLGQRSAIAILALPHDLRTAFGEGNHPIACCNSALPLGSAIGLPNLRCVDIQESDFFAFDPQGITIDYAIDALTGSTFRHGAGVYDPGTYEHPRQSDNDNPAPAARIASVVR